MSFIFWIVLLPSSLILLGWIFAMLRKIFDEHEPQVASAFASILITYCLIGALASGRYVAMNDIDPYKSPTAFLSAVFWPVLPFIEIRDAVVVFYTPTKAEKEAK